MHQIWELDVQLPVSRFLNSADVDALVQAFHVTHERVFAVRDQGSPVECVNWKGRIAVPLGSGRKSMRRLDGLESGGVPYGHRRAFFGDALGIDTPIYRGEQLTPGAIVAGPAIIEEPATTVVVYPGMSARLSKTGSFILSIPPS
jgi:N-methylhydantoinase A